MFDCASNTPPSTYSLRSSGRLFSRYKYPGKNIDNSKKYKIIKKDRENHLVIQWLFLIAYFFVTAFLFFSARFKRSRPEVFCQKGALKNFAKIKGKHRHRSPIFDKVAGLRPSTLLKNSGCFRVSSA